MVQVHAPQGVGVRVPSWAPEVEKPRAIARGFFCPVGVLIKLMAKTLKTNDYAISSLSEEY
jgi:hypothetical protein